MPNRYAEEHFKRGKIVAVLALLRALEEEKLPRERGHSFKAGQIEKYLDLPLQPRTLLAVLRDADVPHDNNCRFLPWLIYDHLPSLRLLPQGYLRGPLPNLLQVEQEGGPEVEETGNMEDAAAQGGGEVKGDEATAAGRSSPSETGDKAEVEPGQGAVKETVSQDGFFLTDEGVDSEGRSILHVSGPAVKGSFYAYHLGIDSRGKTRFRPIFDGPPPVSKREEPESQEIVVARSEDVEGKQAESRPEPGANPSSERPGRPKRPGVGGRENPNRNRRHRRSRPNPL